jgi:hypothetical protein
MHPHRGAAFVHHTHPYEGGYDKSNYDETFNWNGGEQRNAPACVALILLLGLTVPILGIEILSIVKTAENLEAVSRACGPLFNFTVAHCAFMWIVFALQGLGLACMQVPGHAMLQAMMINDPGHRPYLLSGFGITGIVHFAWTIAGLIIVPDAFGKDTCVRAASVWGAPFICIVECVNLGLSGITGLAGTMLFCVTCSLTSGHNVYDEHAQHLLKPELAPQHVVVVGGAINDKEVTTEIQTHK